ncbi:hypothetical protein SEA_REINDEER_43 [Mycobacterium phage Reindeer]|uniref:Uncharacterized protein n=1 Tax=Mycobacterium phage Reindeer TaxID=2762283 RepID=A0A7G8LHY1_9CAUD|nr:hypothetical protein J4U05_gp043 [Mycobacterium phage Reindeer]QNJ56853.1 hypothetical protein SEA_REINDEER_43 [Mycobacterium phage Reindeer]
MTFYEGWVRGRYTVRYIDEVTGITYIAWSAAGRAHAEALLREFWEDETL